MSILVPFNGSNFIIPTPGETGWGSNLDSFFVAIGAGCLQKIGGSFLLASEVDFGASFGLKSLYYKAETGTLSTTGTLRLASADPGVAFRNSANSGNLVLTTNSSDQLTFDGVPIGGSGIFTASRAVVTDSSGNLTVSATTSTEIGYVSGVTSAIQTQLNLKAPLASPTFTGTVVLPIVSATDNMTFSSGKGIFWTDSGVKTVKLTAPTTLTNTYALKWPLDQGSSNQYLTNDGSGNLSWTNAAGTGTVNSGTANQLAYYATSTNAVSGLTAITASRALVSNGSGLPIAATTTATEIGFVNGVTSAIQTQMDLKSPLASPTFTGTVTTPALVVTNTSNQVVLGTTRTVTLTAPTPATTSRVVTFPDLTADYSVVGTAGTQIIGGSKTFSSTVTAPSLVLSASSTTALTMNSGTVVIDSASGSISLGTGSLPGLDIVRAGTGSLFIRASNTLTTAGSDSILIAQVGGTAAGDPHTRYTDGTNVFVSGIDTSDSHKYKISSGATLGTNDALTVDLTSLAVSIHGTNTNDSAAAGFVGETIKSFQTATDFPATTTFGDLTSISLTAGDWLVSLVGSITVAGTATTSLVAGISTTTGNSTTGLTNGDTEITINIPASGSVGSYSLPGVRLSLSGSATAYFKYSATFTGTTPRTSGRISAVRIR